MAISLVSKMFGSGLQVDRQASSNTRNVYVPPVNGDGDGHYPYQWPPFFGNWENTIRMRVTKKAEGKGKGKGLLLGPNSPFISVPIIGSIL